MDELIFVCAQPDSTYFHWQLELMMYNFTKFIPKEKCYILCCIENNEPSIYLQNLKKKYPNILCYKDTRKSKEYISSIRPNLYKQFFKEYPHLGKKVFIHDSDIIFNRFPNFESMLNDDICYLSDTINYIGYKYISECADRYQSKYPNLVKDDILIKMAEIVGIKPEIIKKNQSNSGGAQYLLKNINYEFWEKCENQCEKMHIMFKKYLKTYPVNHDIQVWTTDMWILLWNLWAENKETKVVTKHLYIKLPD